ncbi:response regulator transcription factor [Evansella tamaricis]|uniref:Response regulator transcription factor n=1 Tax=Evansella tamaricis TaxID=2069301 RepID=A0ABS6JH25_9BACI|nr:response regulator transcription factor [Evansella tamaricis]MBU9712964.1 response regulator transcription factor [Evansella tamaricis]
MYTVLLVDDEVFVRQGLISLIEWEKCGFKVIAEASNGEDAFDMINKKNPDLVITDIRMPVIDGLELIKKVHDELNKDQKFIIVSGYSDFSYAQKAVRYGVIDFVLKPIDQQEMENTLTTLSATLDDEKQESSNKEKLLLEKLFIQSLEGNIDSDEEKEWSKLLKVSDSKYLYYLLLEINNVLPKETVEENEDRIAIIKNAFGRAGGNTDHFISYEQQDGSVGLLISSNDLVEVRGDVEKFGSHLVKDVSRKSRNTITAFVGKKATDLTSLNISYNTANSIRGYRYLLNEMNVITYEMVSDLPITYNELNTKLYLSLMEQIEENTVTDIGNTVERIFTEFQEKSFAPSALRTTINRCIHGVIERITSMEGDEKKIVTMEPMMNWERFNLTLEELKKMFTSFVIEGSVLIQDLRKENMKGDIHKVKSYVENNYHENISLKSIASKYYMNPVYMGQLFKKTFGLYFKEYLLQLRIDEAKKLLRQTDMRVYEVAEKVGFGSTDYFVTQFEKINKMTPTEYRNQLLKK